MAATLHRASRALEETEIRSFCPPTEWLALNASVKSFIILVNATAPAIQRQDTCVAEANARIQK